MDRHPPLRREQAEVLLRLHDCAVVMRDESHRLLSCNAAYERVVSRALAGVQARTQLSGTVLTDLVTARAAEERERIQQGVMETGIPDHHFQLGADRRLFCTIMALDPESFGHRGIIALAVPASIEDCFLEQIPDIQTLRTPALLCSLLALTRRELEILHSASRGHSAAQIARELHRAPKTVEHHIASIHRKLGVANKGHLVRFGVERGLHAFSSVEWSTIIEGMFPGAKDDTN